MKRTILFLTALLFTVAVFGQEVETSKKTLFFDEFSVSVNRTNVSNPRFKNRFGVGTGAYHSFMLGKQFDMVLGLEYNYTSLFADKIEFGSPRSYCDMIQIHTFSSPSNLRFSIGKKVKYFFDAGIFLGALVAKESGKTIKPYLPTNPTLEILPTYEIEIGIHCGPSFGAGIKIPMKHIEWIVKADYNIELQTLEYTEFDIHYYRLGVGIRKMGFTNGV